jgi:hypothetical protein
MAASPRIDILERRREGNKVKPFVELATPAAYNPFLRSVTRLQITMSVEELAGGRLATLRLPSSKNALDQP